MVKEKTKSKIYRFNSIDSLYIKPEIGVKYILFLNEDKDMQNYYASIEPFSIKIDNNTPILQSNLINGNLPTEETYKIGLNKNINIKNEESSKIDDFIDGMSYDYLIEKISKNK